MQRLLIANRSEIAARIARTASELEIETVAIYAPEDEQLVAEYRATKSVALSGRGAEAYLNIEAIIAVARAEDCDALHPGYGFLSESPELAEACANAGILFVGPSPEVLAKLGDKSNARALAEASTVPVLNGVAAPANETSLLALLENQPRGGGIMLKAAAGGGGRGMRIVRQAEHLPRAFARCSSEAKRSFSSDALIGEQLLESARHIEVQIAADKQGNIVALGDRDCSLQRRHQKLVEIAPAHGLSPSLREQIQNAALTLSRAIAYQGIGTVEFLVDSKGAFFFIEVNPRIQVEHTVTEEVFGIDLVEVQLRLAQDEPLEALGLSTAPAPRGQAVQMRILSETLDMAGLPQPSAGEIRTFRPPVGPGIRVDTAMRAGLSAHPAFDSMIAKLIVQTESEEPVRLAKRALRALEDFQIEGLETNLDALRALLSLPEFEKQTLTTDLIAARAPELHRAAEVFHAARDQQAASSEAEGSTTTSHAHPPAAATTPESQRLPAGQTGCFAPLLGTVLEVQAEAGTHVRAGDSLCIIESMKMEHVVEAEADGRIASIFAAAGQIVSEGDLLLSMIAEQGIERDASEVAVIDPELIRPDLAEVQARHALLLDAARPEAVERRRSRGQRTARENLDALCDADSFLEIGGLAVAAMRKVRPIEDLERKTPGDAIITGFATLNASTFGEEAARCAVLVVDATVLAGTQGFFHHHKIDRILELAEERGTPVVFFPEGGGGRPNDTDASDIFVAGLNVTSFQNFARLSGKVPRVSVVSGFCFAGSAAFAGCADVIIATKNTSLGMGGPAMIEGGGLGVHRPEEVGPVSVLEPAGVIDLVVEDEVEAAAAARRYLSYFQGPTKDWEAADQRMLRHAIPENRRRVYDVREVIETLFDADSVMELRRAYGVGMITALARIEGRPVGLLANDPMHLGGAIDDEGAEKAARFLQLCDAFGLPLVSLCDTPGFMVGPEIEAKAQVRKVSRLFVAGASLKVPVFTIILRKGYGLGAQAMAGGSFVAPFYIAAWPTGEIGGMGLEGAVRLGFKKQLDAQETPAERDALFEKLVGVMYEKGKALNAASQLEFDAVIDPAETRASLLRAMNAAGPIERGTRSFIDTW
ncbi:MAG: carboxyl transferase domain-containing protein [Myxococcota bacterium]